MCIFIVSIFLANKRIVFDLNKINMEGVPDGMTIDTDGNLWIAVYGGHHVILFQSCFDYLNKYINKFDNYSNIYMQDMKYSIKDYIKI